MNSPRAFSLYGGQPFTLWQDPARWPARALVLPARGFTLWLDINTAQPRTWRLPGRSHTLWLDPARWPVPPLRLPADGFTLWLSPETWPPLVELTVPAPSNLFNMPLNISQNNAFTLWTRPAQVTPIPMMNGMTAAQLLQSQIPATAVVLGNSHATAPAVSDYRAPLVVKPIPIIHRLLPLAAGLVAILGVLALMSVASSKQDQALNGKLIEAQEAVTRLTAKLAEESKNAELKLRELTVKSEQEEAKALVTNEENARLVTALAQAQETLQAREVIVAEQTKALLALTTQTEAAKLTAATAETKAQALVVAGSEAASMIKREAAAEVVKLREALAKLEAEKAAALKTAATAEQAAATLRGQLETLKKPAP